MARVLVPLAEGFEELEAVTIIDLLRRADIEVVVAGLHDGPVCGAHGITIEPDSSLAEALTGEFDMLALPGGLPGSDHLAADERIRELLQEMANSGRFTAAICAAPRALAAAGILKGRRATSFPGALSAGFMSELSYEDSAVVTDGKVITSRGPGTAMDFALALVGALKGEDTRNEVERRLQRQAA
ncbi:MAG: DJ-1/PfpI family protein [Gammaproteobacteria bacterium]|nr:DJ-1/PfpI family protein [Gammaproteobacteria bacterium]